MARLANLIYDAVFKHLIEDPALSIEFISRLIGARVASLRLLPQETRRAAASGPDGRLVHVFRVDFAAEIGTADGSRNRVLLELQKANAPDVVPRFRNYLSQNYSVAPRDPQTARLPETLPIVAIYLLGFKLTGNLPKVIRVERRCIDANTGRELEFAAEPFVQTLTHGLVIVQIPKIDGSAETELDR